MNYLKYLCVFVCALCQFQSYAQITISGKIQDDKGKAIISSSIILKDSIGKFLLYTYSNETGKYSISVEKTGQYILSVNSMTFEQKSIELTIENKIEQKSIDFILSPKVIELKEIIIESSRPITIKKDTIVFDAKYFSQGNERVVEDLLKKIPGLNVSSDGTVKVGNQEVEKIMIDGDDFFEKGYKILTKNMAADPIEKVELYQHYSNNKHLKGIENSEKIALNLILKEDAKNIWFGNIIAGYGLGSEKRHEVKGNLMNFGKKNKHYFLSSINNVGIDGTGDINQLIRPFRFNEPSSIGDDQSAGKLLGLGAQLPNLKQKRIDFNNEELLSLNSIFTLSQKTKLKTLGFLNTDENDFFNNGLQSFSFENFSFENTENFIGRKTQFTGFGKLDLTHDISKTKTLEFTGKFNRTKEKNSNNLLFNNDLLKEKLTGNNQLFDQKLVFTNRFRENKVLLITGRYIKEKTPQNYGVNQFIFDDLFIEKANNTAQFSQGKMQFAGFEAHLLDKKKNGNLLELKAGNQLRIDNLDTRFQLLKENQVISEPLNYQSNLSYTTNDLYVSARYLFKLNRLSLSTQSDIHYLNNQLDNQITKLRQNPLIINPTLGVGWRINKDNNITTSYSINTSNAEITDVYSGFVQTGFRSFEKGLEAFNQLNSSSASLIYTYGSWGSKFFANTSLNYSKNNDFFSTNSSIAQNYSQSEKIIIKDSEYLSVSSSIDRYFKAIKSNLKATISGSKTNFKNVVNNSSLREIKNSGAEYGIELRSGFRGIINYHTGTKWNYNQVRTSIVNSFTNNMTFVDLSFMLNEKFNIEVQSESYYFGNLENGSNKYYFMDLEGRYVVKENKLTFSLSGNNLLNTKTFKNYSITDIMVSKTEYRLQPRNVLLKMEYKF